MNEERRQRVYRARASSDRICKGMFLGFVSLCVLLALLEATTDTDTDTGFARFAAIVVGVAALLCGVVVIVTAGLSHVVLNPDGYVRKRDRPLPSWGRTARSTSRVALRVFLFTWLPLPLALMVLEVVGHFALGWDEWGASDWVTDPLRFVVPLALLVAFGAALVWLAAEAIAGFREKREPPRPSLTAQGPSRRRFAG